jgi:alkanesulfonate monooxygenase SsuD/methylene tetrahydromethanopterin reductase-like flavin-dependent oxidoreductase (luciferase family)/FAD/FMN-containing dehydrogenase
MTDYGHDLRLGAFLSPQSRRPRDVVTLAQLSEQSGLDLVTFQDHPYQPALLDTWTLLSYVAAATDRIHLAPDVLNLPLRQPAVTARAAASLDLLAGGRVSIGIGAGGFWDGIAAMGGPRRTPGESIEALGEAIDVLRQMWDVGERGDVRVEGKHYQVIGAERGPEPAHDIPIWVGAYKPRGLRLLARKADGWLPSLPYVDARGIGIAGSNETIDEAAIAAGRDPREIRRLLNLDVVAPSVDDWVEQLLPFVVEHGFGTLILGSDDPRTIQTFGEEVGPALRAAVERERRSAGTPTGPVRGRDALAQRVAGIEYDAVPSGIEAIEPGDRAYSRVRSTFLRRGTPGLVLRPETADQVAEALAYARAQDVPLAIRSGGHGISGRSTNDGGIVLDVGKLDSVEIIDAHTGEIRVGPGARWGEVAQVLQPHGLGMSSGDHGDVGVGGLATAGGIGLLGRKHGLTIDHVTAAEVVLADSRTVRADAHTNPDLLWAVRGAGGNFGIVTAFELDAYALGEVVLSLMTFDARDTAAFLERWGATAEAAPRELTSFLSLAPSQGVAQLQTVIATDDIQLARSALTPLLDAGPLLDQQAQLVPYAAVVAPHGGVHEGGSAEPAFRSGLVDHLTPEVAAAIAALAISGEAPLIQVRQVGGAINDVDPMATAYAHRTQNFCLGAVGLSPSGLNRRWDSDVQPLMQGRYLSGDTDARPERLHDAFPGATLDRLRALKALYDPDNVFDQNLPIAPASAVRPAA